MKTPTGMFLFHPPLEKKLGDSPQDREQPESSKQSASVQVTVLPQSKAPCQQETVGEAARPLLPRGACPFNAWRRTAPP